VTASSLTSVGTLANLTVTNPITGSVTGSSGSTTGNAATATALQTARTINGTSFNGTADITVTAAAGTLTGSTLASGVTASSLTSVGTLSSLAVSGTTALNGQTYTWPSGGGTTGQVLSTNGSGTLSWATVSGGGGTTTNSLTAGTYLTGGSFNGSAAITFAVDATSANTVSKVVARDSSGNFSAGTITATLSGAAPAGSLSGSTLASGVTASSLTSVGTLSALTMGGTVSMADNVISRPRFTDYAETYTTPAISSGTLTLNIENGNVFRVSRNANISTVTISNPAATGNACSFTLIFDANGTSYTITWPAAVKWPGGTAPTITTTNSRSDMFVFYTNNAGTTWYAMTAAQNFVTS
jgi:hypothetical protein